jgi:threonine dehydrogenase-like Zn-dependent dehydrogenase
MKAVVWHGRDNNDFNYEEVAYPDFGPNQIVIKVEAVAICGSDFHLKDFDATAPLIPGHEVSGIVVDVGEDVKSINVGDRVAMDPVQKCGDCYSCKHKFKNLCVNYRHLGDGMTPGGWAEYMPVDAENAYKFSQELSFEAACLIEPAAVCCQSFERANLQKGDDVLVLGDGPFGFMHAMSARAIGAGKIIVAGHYDERLKRIAAKTNAVICNTHNENLEEILSSEITDKPGVDIAIEATGASSVPGMGLKALRPQGTLVLFSYVWSPEPLEMGMIHMKELNVIGSCRSNCYKKCLQLIEEGKIETEELVDKVVALKDYQTALSYLRENKKDVFKAVLQPESEI